MQEVAIGSDNVFVIDRRQTRTFAYDDSWTSMKYKFRWNFNWYKAHTF